jgi:hypothetical protein
MVTAPVLAKVRPSTEAPVVSVMLAWARMLPAKEVMVPSVAELPTAQKTLQLWAPLINCTLERLAVVNVLPMTKINTALEFP